MVSGSGYDYTKKAAEDATDRLIKYFTAKGNISNNQGVVCGTLSDDWKTIKTDDGRTLNCIVEGHPRNKRLCGFMMNSNTVLITQGTRYVPTTDQSLGKGWLVIGGQQTNFSGHPFGDPEFNIVDTKTWTRYRV